MQMKRSKGQLNLHFIKIKQSLWPWKLYLITSYNCTLFFIKLQVMSDSKTLGLLHVQWFMKLLKNNKMEFIISYSHYWTYGPFWKTSESRNTVIPFHSSTGSLGEFCIFQFPQSWKLCKKKFQLGMPQPKANFLQLTL